MPYLVLVDGDNLPQVITVEAAAGEVSFTLTASYHDWGGAVIRPPADAVDWADIAVGDR